MTVDPSDPETFERIQPDEPDPEAPEADAAEQQADLRPRSDDPLTDIDRDTANEADAAEQARVVAEDEDDYR
ncbi:hypothetical protein ACWD4L_50295 [Streptomyces sp. NPDC002596]|uniref:hypothetical protein n=1 Tax=unclassified Streptomyces TaxID=2593676 RepID=UPI00225B7339|nr:MULTISPECIES: hypothetical protein [unclassified Streptomyces]MCX4532811.1 hypothetical protein [Streptomyces sp. NBC_01669]WSA01727.1 hypothetical protein OHA79_30105 [Streptomyces sp. NBC_00841]WSJ95555.1 hypothetical protein OG395_21900 [Streptomyces sp. NBC_01320]